MVQQNGDTDPATRIATSNAPRLRILAGPGTGKSHTLKLRVKALLEKGVAPESILVTTFTRTAAEDSKKELEAMKVAGATDVYATTVHALCFSILNRRGVLENLRRKPRVLLEYEKRFLLEDLKHELKPKHEGLGKIRKLKKLLKAFAAAWARDQKDKPGWPSSQIDKLFETCLDDWLDFHEAMLVEELVPMALEYLRFNPASSERTKYSHVLVDEYQDLNVSEQEFINYISQIADVTVIGDENQSIYSFKHAHPEGITGYKERHPETYDETLNVCRRCPQNIVSMAHRLISHNASRIDRPLEALNQIPATVNVVQWNNVNEEANGVADTIRYLIRSRGVKPGQILILSPRKRFGYAIRDALKLREIAAHSFFREQELDGSPTNTSNGEWKAQQALTLLALVANRDDSVALRCWCGFGSANLRAPAWRRVRDICNEQGVSLSNTLEGIRVGRIKLRNGKQIIERLNDLHSKLEELSPLQGRELFNAVFPEDDSELASFRETMADNLADDDPPDSILSALLSSIIQPELPAEMDCVRIMSLHKSKGLTADYVFVLGCIERLLPAYSSAKTRHKRLRDLEEQRRLFYVAVTRVRKFLLLSSTERLSMRDVTAMNMGFHSSRSVYITKATRFLKELGPSCPPSQSGKAFLGLFLNL